MVKGIPFNRRTITTDGLIGLVIEHPPYHMAGAIHRYYASSVPVSIIKVMTYQGPPVVGLKNSAWLASHAL